MMHIPYSVPISVKGIVFENGKVWLRKNERNEWELPGGKLDRGEQPQQTVIRELREELGFETEIKTLIQAQMYTIHTSDDEHSGVLVLTYVCALINKVGEFENVGEAGKTEFNTFSINEIQNLNMPVFYKESIEKAFKETNLSN